MTQSANRRSLLMLAGAGLALTLSVTGCRVGAHVGNTEPTTGSDAGSTGGPGSAGTAGTSSGQSPAAQAPAASVPRCTAAQLRADMQEQPSDSEEKVLATLMLTNTSGRTCMVPAGWAPLGLGGAGGPYYSSAEGARENYPGPGVNITVRPGRTVFAGLRYGTSPDCPTAGGWAVSWQGSWLPVNASWQNGPREMCPGTLSQGTLQPSMNGVNYS
ncbi:DUF4232 domain-containing protein [Actinomadura latina]|uniref:DUF4232 domain-containing protein n=1 Tax=Actinomadura latina TaxID=163603 RepID=A0A846Z0W6_9ACTN|nr:DUF4232 domain-containing protein [Actinomadura latina]NKZ05567.1 DUF4232 domain-containing protein [Actinomadura latina]